MPDKIKTFLKSNLLVKYLLNQANEMEIAKVETYLATYPEVQKAYHKLQKNLEVVAHANAQQAPTELLTQIIQEINPPETKQFLSIKKHKKPWYKYAIAASIAAFIFAGSTMFFYNYNQKLKQENQIIADEIFDLRNDIQKNNQMLSSILKQFNELNNPETEKYIINGNERAKNLKTVAYINPIKKTSLIDVVSLPQLPEGECYQIWAELQDKMVSLGILNETNNQLIPLPYTENALGINITIEPKGGNKQASLEKTVAEISLKSKK